MVFKENYKKIVIGFISVLIVLTLSSKSIYYAVTPKVEYQTYISGELADTTLIRGEIVGKNSRLYYIDEELMVLETCQNESEKVEKGDLLFRLDVSPLEKQLDDLKERRSDLKLRRSQYNADQNDKVFGVEECKLEIADLRDEYISQKELHDAGILSESELKSFKDKVDAKERELKRLESKLGSNNDDNVNVTDIYEEEEDRIDNKIRALEEKISNYREFRSDISGSIVYSDIEVGKVANSGQILYKIYTPGSGYELTAEIPSDFAKNIKIGDSMVIRRLEKGENLNCRVISLIKENSITTIRLDIADDEVENGEIAVFSIVNSLGKYEKTVSTSAIHRENGLDYIYVIRESSSMLGKEFITERIQVDVIGKTSEKVAIESGELTSSDRIIIDSTEFLTDKMKIVVKL